MVLAPPKGWDYKWFPSDAEREQRCIALVADVGSGRVDPIESCSDTRPVHEQMFRGMTDVGDEYFAGHYRGEPFPHLENYNVHIPADNAVGMKAHEVMDCMQKLSQFIFDLPAQHALRTHEQLPVRKLVTTVGLVCTVMVEFFTVHPYANGNGHVGRYITWALLVKFGHPPRRWEVNHNFGDRSVYSESIKLFRRGDRTPLVRFVMSSI